MSVRSMDRSRWWMAGLLVAAVTATGVAAGCGSSSGQGTSAASPSPSASSVQVLATAQRGDLVQTATGRLILTVKNGKTTTVAQIQGPQAALVAAGQSAQLVFFKAPAGVGQGGQMPASPPAGFGQGGQGGQMPASPPAGFGQGGQMPASPPAGFGQGGAAPSGQGAPGLGTGAAGPGRFGGKTAKGTVTAVKQGAGGTTTASIAVAKLPTGVTAKYMGIASIQVKVLATNVVVVPAAAVTGSGANATVTVIAGGKTSPRKVVVGQKTAAEAEIVSGLSAGENIVYRRTFNGFRFGQPGGQGLGPSQSGGQSTKAGGQ